MKPGTPASIGARAAASGLALGLIAILLAAAAGAAQAAVPSTFFGMSAIRATAEDYEQIKETGAGSVRVEVPWRLVQKSADGPFDFSPIDVRFRDAAATGLRPFPLLWRAPDFLTSSTKIIGPVKTSEQRQGWTAFVTAALGRYGPGGKFWVENPQLDATLAPRDWLVWNEQSVLVFWDPAPDPGEYARLIRLTRAAADKVAPSVRLIAGGIYGEPSHEKSIRAESFLRRLYRKPGIKQDLAGFSSHPYAVNIAGVKRQIKELRKVAVKAGERDARMYIGEIGWASDGFGGVLVKNKAQQAELLDRAYRVFLKRRNAWNIEGAYWFTWRDYNEDSLCTWCNKAGLVTRQAEKKPAARAYKKLVAERTSEAGESG